jgi:hypothetical protein
VIDRGNRGRWALLLDLARVAPPPRLSWLGSDSPDDELHEHPIEPPDQIPIEPLSPHPGSDPVEVTTETRPEHPVRPRLAARGVVRTHGVTRQRRMRPSR